MTHSSYRQFIMYENGEELNLKKNKCKFKYEYKKKKRILGAVEDLPANHHSQSGPIPLK